MTASKEIHAFLQEARTCDEPSEEKGAALRELVDRRIAAAAACAPSSNDAASPGVAASGSRLFALRLAIPVGLACFTLVAGAIRGSFVARPAPPVSGEAAGVSPLSPRATRPAEPSAPEVSRASTAPPSEEHVDVRDLPDAPKAASGTSLAKPSAPIDRSLEIETKILRGARAARLAGAPERSLSLVEEHASRFPNGALAPERDAERISALCALGRVEQARERITEFERRDASSALLGRVRSSCRGAP